MLDYIYKILRGNRRGLLILVHSLQSLLTKKAVIIPAGAIMMVGLLISMPNIWREILSFFATHDYSEVGPPLIIVPPVLILLVAYIKSIWNIIFRKNITFSERDDFLSVDLRSSSRRKKNDSIDPKELLSAIHNASRQEFFDYDKIRDIVEKTVASNKKNKDQNNATFITYFSSIVETLEAKADAADEKASILLNKGTAYSQGGIIFFILSIIIWQSLSWHNQFQTHFIYGIVSCSILFAFIEFLSAWFLRQYRHFVDTSTYLLRVKSILDRYLLTYLAAKEQAKADGSIDGKAFATLNLLLKEPIRWPETELFDKANTNFAKDAADSLTSLAKEVKRKKSP